MDGLAEAVAVGGSMMIKGRKWRFDLAEQLQSASWPHRETQAR